MTEGIEIVVEGIEGVIEESEKVLERRKRKSVYSKGINNGCYNREFILGYNSYGEPPFHGLIIVPQRTLDNSIYNLLTFGTPVLTHTQGVDYVFTGDVVKISNPQYSLSWRIALFGETKESLRRLTDSLELPFIPTRIIESQSRQDKESFILK
jgi:hypothetical protein